MAIRAIGMHRILKHMNSLYFHCDATMSHYIKMMLDTIGGKNFRKIVWRLGWVSGYKVKKIGWIRNYKILRYYVKYSNFSFHKEYIGLSR